MLGHTKLSTSSSPRKSFIHWMTRLIVRHWLNHVTTNFHKFTHVLYKVREQQWTVLNTFRGLTLDLSFSCNINACKCRGGENDKCWPPNDAYCKTLCALLLHAVRSKHQHILTQWFNQKHPWRGTKKLLQSYLGVAVQEITKERARKMNYIICL